MTEIELWFNARCSKCRAARDRLTAAGVPHRLYRYLDDPPARSQLVALLAKLGTTDPTTIARTSDPDFVAAGVPTDDADAVLDALVAHPAWIQRPIAVCRQQAVVARPPERVDELVEQLLGGSGGCADADA